MSKIGPNKAATLMMGLYEALNNGETDKIKQIKIEIESSDSEITKQEMNKLFASEEKAETSVREKMNDLSDIITTQEQYDIGKGLYEVYSRLPLYYQDKSLLKMTEKKLTAYKQRQIVQKQVLDKQKRAKKKPFWQRTVMKVMTKLGYSQTQQKPNTHQKIEQATRIDENNGETLFSSDDENN